MVTPSTNTNTNNNNNTTGNEENIPPSTTTRSSANTAGQTQASGQRGRTSRRIKHRRAENAGKSLWSGYKGHGGTPEFGAVLGTSSKNGLKDTPQNFMRQGQLWMSKGGIRDGWKDVVCIFREGKQPNIGQPPADLDDTVKEGSVKRLLHEAKVECHFQREELLEVNVPTVCNVVWGQFSAALREELKGLNEFEERYIKYDVVWLLEQAKLIALGVDANAANAYATVHRMMRSLYSYRQDAKEGCETYSKDLNDLIKTVKLAGGNPLYHPTLHEVEVVKLVKARGGKKYDNAMADEIEEGKKISEENFRAILLLEQADPGQFFPLWLKLRTDATLGNNNYPTTWAQSYDILNKYNTINGQKKKQPYSQNPPRDRAVSQSGRSHLHNQVR